MSHTYSIYKLLVLICVIIVLSGCKEKTDKKVDITIDSLRNDIDKPIEFNIDSVTISSFNGVLKDYSNKYNASTNWIEYNNENKSYANRDLRNKNLIFPLFKEQIKSLHKSHITDTILIYSGKMSNSFVLNITKDVDIFNILKEETNSIMVIRVNDLEYSQKLYLSKKNTDFQHKEKKIIEFYIKADLIDANNLGINDDLINDKFNLGE